jgi:hypothetical protein
MGERGAGLKWGEGPSTERPVCERLGRHVVMIPATTKHGFEREYNTFFCCIDLFSHRDGIQLVDVRVASKARQTKLSRLSC